MISDKDLADIQSYIHQTLPPRRRKVLEDRLQNDPAFRAEFDKYRLILEGLDDLAAQAAIKKKVKSLRERKPVIQPLWTRSRLLMAASVLAVLTVGTFFFLNRDHYANQSAYDTLYIAETPSKGSTLADCPPIVDSALALYYQGRYQESLALLNQHEDTDSYCVSYYKGISHLALEQAPEAIRYLEQAIQSPDPQTTHRAEWYRGLAYLKNDQRAQALAIFKAISQQSSHPFHDISLKAIDKLQ